MRIAEVSSKVNLTNDTIRYYEKVGLLTPIHSDNGRACYGPREIQRLDDIKLLKSLGMSIKEIKSYLFYADLCDENLSTVDDNALEAHLQNLQQIQRKILRNKEFLDGADKKIRKYISKIVQVSSR